MLDGLVFESTIVLSFFEHSIDRCPCLYRLASSFQRRKSGAYNQTSGAGSEANMMLLLRTCQVLLKSESAGLATR